MPELTWTVQCPLPGLEQAAVTYNLMASEADVNALAENLGADDPGGVVVAVTGIEGPRETWPLALRGWLVRAGLQQAVVEFARDPKFWMGSRRSTRPTPTGG